MTVDSFADMAKVRAKLREIELVERERQRLAAEDPEFDDRPKRVEA